MSKHLPWLALALLLFVATGCGDGKKGNGNGEVKPPDGNGGGGPDITWSPDKPRVLIEAAAARCASPFETGKDALAAGGKYLTLPSKGCDGNHHHHIAKEGTPERTAGSAELDFSIKKDGEYILWIRKWTCCSCGDSWKLQIDGGKAFTFGNQGTTHRHWSWLAHQDADGKVGLKLKKGEHKLKIINRGESGLRIDQILLWADPKSVPQGQEKP